MTPDFTGTTLNSRYTLLRRIGHGGFATVYEANDRQIDKRVAVKVLNPRYSHSEEFRKRFIQEARAAARVRHRLLVDVSDQGVTTEGTLFFVMELLRGVSLGDRIRDRPGPMPWRHVVAIATELARALEFAHDHGIVHRDVKPGNIFLVEGPGHGDDLQIKLLDLGIAKIQSDVMDTDAPETRESQGAPGTPEYMAPEQVHEGAKGPSVDIYAVGVLMYRLLTGSLPFASKTPFAVLKMHVEDIPVPPTKRCPEAEIPARVEAVVLKLMEKRPEDRFASARELRLALQELLRADALAQRRPGLSGLAQHRLIRITANFCKFSTAAITFMLLTLFTTPALQSAGPPPPRRVEAERPVAVVIPSKAAAASPEAPPAPVAVAPVQEPEVEATPSEEGRDDVVLIDDLDEEQGEDEVEAIDPAPAKRTRPASASTRPQDPPTTGAEKKKPSASSAEGAAARAEKDIERKLARSKSAIATKCKQNIVPETLNVKVTVDLATGAPSTRILGQSSPQRECVRAELDKLKYTSVRGEGLVTVSTTIAIPGK